MKPLSPEYHSPFRTLASQQQDLNSQQGWLSIWQNGPDSQHVHPGSLYLQTPPLGIPAIFQGLNCQGMKKEEKYQVVLLMTQIPARCICYWQQRASRARNTGSW